MSSDILIEDCYAYGASDAGIYVGQSDKAVIRDCLATGNVAGIEIENTTNTDVYDNMVTENAAGILVFDLPGLSQPGSFTRIFDNRVIRNLRGNFVPPGGIVAEVPAGTGILVLSTANVEIFDNEIAENNLLGTAVASYAALVNLGLVSQIQDPNYNPFPEQIHIHDNTYQRSEELPDSDMQSTLGNLLVQVFGASPVPDLVLDGIFAPGSGNSGSICLGNNDGSTFVNLNLPADFPNNLSFDATSHNCSLDPLPEVVVTVPTF